MPRAKLLLLSLAAALIIYYFCFSIPYIPPDPVREKSTSPNTHPRSSSLQKQVSTSSLQVQKSNTPPANNYAFSAFLAAPSMPTEKDDDDLYFVGTRMLMYQLLYDPETRTNNSYPFVVLVTQDVSK
jgi:hypothetical protein